MRLWVEERFGHREEARALLERMPGLRSLAPGPDPVERAQAVRNSFDVRKGIPRWRLID